MPNISAKTKAARHAAAEWQSKMTYWEADGFTKGMPVEVLSVRIKGLKGVKPFTYASHVRNNRTGSEWVDVLDAQRNTWSFKPDQITQVKPKRKYTRRK